MVHPCFIDESYLTMCSRSRVIKFADERGSEERVYTRQVACPYNSRQRASSFYKAHSPLSTVLSMTAWPMSVRLTLGHAHRVAVNYCTVDIDAKHRCWCESNVDSLLAILGQGDGRRRTAASFT